MDSNVSKTTFFYKFIKLQLSQKTRAIGDLFKQDLLRTIDLYSQRYKLDLDLPVIAHELERKILLLYNSDSLTSFLNDRGSQIDSKLKFTHLVYRCAIAFSLASYCQLSPQDIAKKLTQILAELESNSIHDDVVRFAVVAHTSGYLDFYLTETFLASWLERSLEIIAARSITSSNYAPICIEASRNSLNLVPLQYVHSRCCSLLSLGARAKLIKLREPSFEYLTWHIAQPKSISWLDAQNRLWLSQQVEHNLLWQLLKVVDASATNLDNWYQLAKNLSQAMMMFDGECRILGEVAHKYPQKALARLGLIGLVQYWLQQLLYQKKL